MPASPRQQARGLWPLQALNFLTAQGIGASLSPALGGWLSQGLGYPAAFLILGSFAVVSVVLWLMFAAAIQHASAISADAPDAGAQAMGLTPRRAAAAR